MNKSQELELFRSLISSFPADSYIGEWLRQSSCEVENALRSDIVPEISLANAARQVESVVNNARNYAQRIIADAEHKVEQIKEEGVRKRRALADELTRTVNAIQNLY